MENAFTNNQHTECKTSKRFHPQAQPGVSSSEGKRSQMLFEFFMILLRKVNLNNDIALKSCGVTRPYQKLKTFYLHYHSAYGHQTLYGGNLHNPSIKWSSEVTCQIEYLYFHFNLNNGQQTWQGGDLP